jgi:hypothetical protein
MLSFRLILGSKRQEKYKKTQENTRKYKKTQENTRKDNKRQQNFGFVRSPLEKKSF